MVSMTFIFVALPIVIIAWMFYASRELVLSLGRWALRRRYDVSLSGTDCVDSDRIYLVVPNHPAIVDPLLVVTELYHMRILIRPLVDESFFSHRLTRHVLSLFDAVRVPDFRMKNFRPICAVRPSRLDSAKRAKSLAYTVLATLTAGKNVLLYPSGHITSDGKESLGNRQLAYNVATRLPADVHVLAVRTRGLYGSVWSRVRGRPAPPYVKTLIRSVLLWLVAGFRKRRRVSIHFEDITERCRKWALLDRPGFNMKMEEWYNSDLTAVGRECEEAT
jgi:long-chain-fatty-acid--[acyl-carrier-protein] ligase